MHVCKCRYIHVYTCTCRLVEKFQSEEQSPPVPVLVVTKDTGRELLRLVRENPREVFVKVDQLSLHDIVERGGERSKVMGSALNALE